jgi:hypothetical protein
MNDYNPEYDDEAGMADNNLETLKRSVEGIDKLIQTGDNLPEWCQEKIAIAKSMLVTVWDYMRSEEDRGVTEGKKSRRDPIRTIKAKSATKIDMEKARKQAAKKKKKKSNYSESLEIQLFAKLGENRDMKNWDQTPGRIMPAQEDTGPTYDVRREGDEWVVIITKKGKKSISRISTDEADTRDDAIRIATGSTNESKEQVSVIYVDGNPTTKYANLGDAKKDADQLKTKFPKKKIEIKSEIGENKKWTHDSLAAKLFEQDHTYEDTLNRMLKGKLKK